MSSWPEYRIENASDILTVLTTLSENYSLIFRGQAANWQLQPSIQRLFPVGHSRAEIAVWEAAAIQNFRRHARAYLPVAQLAYLDTMLGTLTLMQHYGAPTRLLDWTFSPWVAAYFAAVSHPEDDGVIWAFDRDCMSRDENWGIDPEKHDVSKVLQHFEALTGAVKVVDWIKYSANPIPIITSFIYEFADPRISAQQSLFTISGTLGVNHAEELARRLSGEKRHRIVVPQEIKAELVNLLWRMNIGPMSIFPGMDGVGRFVSDAIRNHLPIDHSGRAWVLRETDDGRDLGLR